jgi:hypothetical protein
MTKSTSYGTPIDPNPTGLQASSYAMNRAGLDALDIEQVNYFYRQSAYPSLFNSPPYYNMVLAINNGNSVVLAG